MWWSVCNLFNFLLLMWKLCVLKVVSAVVSYERYRTRIYSKLKQNNFLILSLLSKQNGLRETPITPLPLRITESHTTAIQCQKQQYKSYCPGFVEKQIQCHKSDHSLLSVTCSVYPITCDALYLVVGIQ